MITEKPKKIDFKSMSLMASDNEQNEYKGHGFKISQDNLDQINYNSLIDSFTCENTAEVEKYIKLLEQSKRTDLLDKFYKFKAEYEQEQNKKLNQPFLKAISKHIDLNAINPEIVDYLVDVEKRLQKLEAMFEKCI